MASKLRIVPPGVSGTWVRAAHGLADTPGIRLAYGPAPSLLAEPGAGKYQRRAGAVLRGEVRGGLMRTPRRACTRPPWFPELAPPQRLRADEQYDHDQGPSHRPPTRPPPARRGPPGGAASWPSPRASGRRTSGSTLWTLRSMDSGPSNITWNCSWSGDCRGPDRATVRQTTPTSRLSNASGFRSGISARVSPQSPTLYHAGRADQQGVGGQLLGARPPRVATHEHERDPVVVGSAVDVPRPQRLLHHSC